VKKKTFDTCTINIQKAVLTKVIKNNNELEDGILIKYKKLFDEKKPSQTNTT
jgi:hypothetical protein